MQFIGSCCVSLCQMRSLLLFQPQENTLGQKFVVDAVLWADIAKSGRTDSLEDTLDYRKVYRCVPCSVCCSSCCVS